jgi:hypothetical protein
MERLTKLEDMVRTMLTYNPRTRDRDLTLAYEIWTKVYGVSPSAQICDVMEDDRLPSPESLGRVRRKIQQADPSLRGTRRKEKIRLEAQADFIEYAKTDTIKDKI